MSEIQRQHAYNTPQFYNIVKNKTTLVSYEDKSILKSISKTMVKLDFQSTVEYKMKPRQDQNQNKFY